MASQTYRKIGVPIGQAYKLIYFLIANTTQENDTDLSNPNVVAF